MKRFCFALGLAAVLGATGCSEEKSTQPQPDPPPTYRAPTSEANVLENLQTAHRLKDIDGYDAAMHEEFMFVPNGADPDIDFVSFNRLEDHESTRNMFEVVEDIDMNLVFGDAVESDVSGYEGDEYSKIEVTDVTLRVQTREGAAGDPLIYLITGDVARFIFKRDDTPDPPTYTIIYQADLGSARLPAPERPEFEPVP